MRWLGPMLHMMFPPKHDAVAERFATIIDQRREASADIRATRQRLERIAADRGAAIDDIAGERG